MTAVRVSLHRFGTVYIIADLLLKNTNYIYNKYSAMEILGSDCC